MIKKNFHNDPRIDGLFPYAPLLKKDIRYWSNGGIIEESYYIFYKYIALYMEKHNMFKNNIINIDKYWVNNFYNYEEININKTLSNDEMEKMANFILCNGLINTKTKKEFIYKPVVQDEQYYCFDYDMLDLPYERYNDVIAMHIDWGTKCSKHPYAIIVQYGGETLSDKEIIENVEKNILSLKDESWKLQLKEIFEKLNLFNTFICNRRCTNCGDILYKTKGSNIEANLCDNCLKKKANIKATRRTDFLSRGYKMCSNGRIEKFLSTTNVYNRYNGICCNCNKQTSFDVSRFDPLYPNKDHIVPIDKGGENIYINSQLLCRKCNMEKNVKINQYILEQYLKDKELYEKNFDEVKSTNIISNLRCYNCHHYDCHGFINQDNIDFYCPDCGKSEGMPLGEDNTLLDNIIIKNETIKVNFKDFKKKIDKNEIIGITSIVFRLEDKNYYNDRENTCYNPLLDFLDRVGKCDYFLSNVVYILNEVTDEIIETITKNNYFIAILNDDKSLDVLNLDLKGVHIKNDEYFYLDPMALGYLDDLLF